ncbi:hypothetical protein DH2020_019350 [Rehmannia glutinosa]|uniref:Peptidase metallopeptidase domain-containing protein n=1 Tax=Rehmannia glutinosa TaxID=99300 RepID=A0ABR0WLK9_REHGL
MALLQIWAWSRISSIVPQPVRSMINMGPVTVDDELELPLPPYGASHSVRIYREMFDRLTEAQCPLIIYATVEIHHPNRVTRRFDIRRGYTEQQDFSKHGVLEAIDWSQKGDNVEGIHELKQYLAYLGYLNYNHDSSINHINENDNVFDNSLEFALKKYQKFYNLNVTGVIDASTIAKMHEPRCGMPDFYNDKNTLIHMVSHYSFFPVVPNGTRENSNNGNVKEEAISSLERAMQARASTLYLEWASVTPFMFFRVKSLEQANIPISFLRGHHGDELPFGGPNSVGGLAHSFPPRDGRIHFDAAQNWSHSGDENAFDIQTVGLHELGHVLGLGHSNVHQAVMYATIAFGERKKLHGDDIRGIKALYKLK